MENELICIDHDKSFEVLGERPCHIDDSVGTIFVESPTFQEGYCEVEIISGPSSPFIIYLSAAGEMLSYHSMANAFDSVRIKIQMSLPTDSSVQNLAKDYQQYLQQHESEFGSILLVSSLYQIEVDHSHFDLECDFCYEMLEPKHHLSLRLIDIFDHAEIIHQILLNFKKN